MERTLDIYYKDFLPETQSAILEAAGIQDPRETNWDTLPSPCSHLKSKKEATYEYCYGKSNGCEHYWPYHLKM